jgi:hypothetical protein
MLYSIFGPAGAVTTIVPVGKLHEGCTVTEAVGDAGAVGTGLTINKIEDDVQPVVLS